MERRDIWSHGPGLSPAVWPLVEGRMPMWLCPASRGRWLDHSFVLMMPSGAVTSRRVVAVSGGVLSPLWATCLRHRTGLLEVMPDE